MNFNLLVLRFILELCNLVCLNVLSTSCHSKVMRFWFALKHLFNSGLFVFKLRELDFDEFMRRSLLLLLNVKLCLSQLPTHFRRTNIKLITYEVFEEYQSLTLTHVFLKRDYCEDGQDCGWSSSIRRFSFPAFIN